MTDHDHVSPDGRGIPGGGGTDPDTDERTRAFDALMAEVMAGTGRFGHREHVHLTWLAVEVQRHRQPGLGRTRGPPRGPDGYG